MEHLTRKQVEDYSRQRLGAAELLTVSDHLRECEVCRLNLEGVVNGEAAFFALHTETLGDHGATSLHLSPEQTAEYVDKNLSGEALQIVTDHLAGCEQCAFSVDDLRAFRNEIAPSIDREYRPAAVPAAREGRWSSRFESLFRPSRIPAFGGAALAVVLLAVIGWIIWRTPHETEQEVSSTPLSQPSPSLQAESATPQPEPVKPVELVVQLNDGGGVLSLDQQGKLSGADHLPAGYQTLLKNALAGKRIERSSQLQGLTRPPSSLMGSDKQKSEFSVREPVGTVLMTDRPTFGWTPIDGAANYVVEIYDEQFKLIASSPQLTNVSWTSSQSLSRGRVYSWQVKAIKDGQEVISPRPPAPQAKFRILDQAKANELDRAKRAYASSHLTLALLYADAGLLKEAEQELRLLRKANPNSDLVRTLLRQIQH